MKSARGFTALEALISTVIFGFVVVMSFGAMSHSTTSFNAQIREAYLTDKGEKAIRMMQEELADATRVGVQSIYMNVSGYGTVEFPNALIIFQVPIRFTDNATNHRGYSVSMKTLTPAEVEARYGPAPTFSDDYNFHLKYGWRDIFRSVPNMEDSGRMVYLQGPGLMTSSPDVPSGVMGGSGRTQDGYNGYRFQIDPRVKMGKYGVDGVISEYKEDYDLDGDGEKTSVYAIGYIERFYCMHDSSSGLPPPGYPLSPVEASRTRIGESTIVQPIRPYGTAYTATDPKMAANMKTTNLFFSDPNSSSRIDVCIWMLQMNTDGQPYLVKLNVTDFMRNNTEAVLSTSATTTN